MALLSRGYVLLAVLLAVLCIGQAMAKSTSRAAVEGTGTLTQKPVAKEDSPAAAPSESGPRALRAAKASPELAKKPAVPAASKEKSQPEEPQFQQQILVVKGNPTQEKLNEEIRKALRALLGSEEGDQVQIRQLKDVDELRRVVPGAGPGPIGLKVVP